MVGPFIFFDHMGPCTFEAGNGFDVRPHPHIGLATISYLLEGEVVHRDHLGSTQTLHAGEINWMTAGSGIVHSERTPQETRATGGSVHGFQIWVALPKAIEEMKPEFTHYAADEAPRGKDGGTFLTVIAGAQHGLVSPVQTTSDMVLADVTLLKDSRYQIVGDHIERAIYIVSGSIEITGQAGQFHPGQLVVLAPGEEVVLKGLAAARVMLMGGEPFPETRYIDWNFVSSSADRIRQARVDWREQRFPVIQGESGFIPLPPENRLTAA